MNQDTNKVVSRHFRYSLIAAFCKCFKISKLYYLITVLPFGAY